MLTFLDGPAQGHSLRVGRAPLLLRAVQARNGRWDVLDQLDDEPKPHERIYVYRLVGEPGRVHFKMKQRSQSGFSVMADYRFFPTQPSEDVLRDTQAWREWTEVAEVRAAVIEARRQEAAAIAGLAEPTRKVQHDTGH